jgi:hypothetical protein
MKPATLKQLWWSMRLETGLEQRALMRWITNTRRSTGFTRSKTNQRRVTSAFRAVAGKQHRIAVMVDVTPLNNAMTLSMVYKMIAATSNL